MKPEKTGKVVLSTFFGGVIVTITEAEPCGGMIRVEGIIRAVAKSVVNGTGPSEAKMVP